MDYSYQINTHPQYTHLWQVKVYAPSGKKIAETACLNWESVLEFLKMVRSRSVYFFNEAG